MYVPDIYDEFRIVLTLRACLFLTNWFQFNNLGRSKTRNETNCTNGKKPEMEREKSIYASKITLFAQYQNIMINKYKSDVSLIQMVKNESLRDIYRIFSFHFVFCFHQFHQFHFVVQTYPNVKLKPVWGEQTRPQSPYCIWSYRCTYNSQIMVK